MPPPKIKLKNNFIDRTIIISGDLNIYIYIQIQVKTNQAELICLYLDKKTKKSKKLFNMMEELCLLDIYRFANLNGKHFAWGRQGRVGLVQSRLDIFFLSQHLQYQNIKYKHYPGLMSHHSLKKLILKKNDILD